MTLYSGSGAPGTAMLLSNALTQASKATRSLDALEIAGERMAAKTKASAAFDSLMWYSSGENTNTPRPP